MTMPPRTKTVQLLEMESGKFVIEGDITVQIAADLKRGLEYAVYLAVDGYHPELDGKSWLMKVGSGDPGEVSVKMIGNPGKAGTRFEVFLKAPLWRGWNQLRSLARSGR